MSWICLHLCNKKSARLVKISYITKNIMRSKMNYLNIYRLMIIEMIINIVKDVVNLILAIFQNCKFNGNVFWITIMVRGICAKRMMKQLMLILIHALLRFNYFTTVVLQRPCVHYISIFLCIHIIWSLRNINYLWATFIWNVRYGTSYLN